MKFYFPDSQDQVSTTFNFEREEYSPFRVRQRDDSYAHEVLTDPPYDGMLVSKAIVDGNFKGTAKYTPSMTLRLSRNGVREFFRLPETVETLGDCGAFAYVDEEVPPYTVAEVADFYEGCRFDAGVSLDHVVLGYDRTPGLKAAPEEWQNRRLISLRYADAFLDECHSRGTPFQPVGAAQGWNPESYADSVRQLRDMGYRRIALGGMVPLKTRDVLACLHAVSSVLKEVAAPGVELHLLGVTRLDSMSAFSEMGVTSFDSTSPFRQAFMDDRDNYHTVEGHYTALRIPQVDANPTLKQRVLSGELDQRRLVHAEEACLRAVRAAGTNAAATDDALETLSEYESLWCTRKSYMDRYRTTLRDRPWATCPCSLCQELGVDIVIFRGTERNKRRGFHNLSVLKAGVQHLNASTRRVA